MLNEDGSVPSTARLIAALTIFVGVLLCGVFFVTYRSVPVGELGEERAGDAAKAGGEDGDTLFFYNAIGHAPPAFKALTDGTANQSKNSYTLEIRVAGSRGEAEQVIDKLHGQGIEAYYTPLTRAGRVVYRVRQGIFANQKDADRAALAVHKAYAIEPKVVKLQ